MDFIILNATENNDNVLALKYALKYDSILNSINQTFPIQSLTNKNVKYDLEKTESFNNSVVLIKLKKNTWPGMYCQYILSS